MDNNLETGWPWQLDDHEAKELKREMATMETAEDVRHLLHEWHEAMLAKRGRDIASRRVQGFQVAK
jgi:hypothetical protein